MLYPLLLYNLYSPLVFGRGTNKTTHQESGEQAPMRATAELRNTATIGSRCGLATTPIVLRLGGTANNNSLDNEARRVYTLYKGCGGSFEGGNLPDRFSSAFCSLLTTSTLRCWDTPC